jgi:hypothetical protein
MFKLGNDEGLGATLTRHRSVWNFPMLLFRSLAVLLALGSPTFCQDGPRDAASAKEAAQVLAAYLDTVFKSGGRPDYINPPVPDLLHRVFNMEELAALSPPKPSDLAWLLDLHAFPVPLASVPDRQPRRWQCRS